MDLGLAAWEAAITQLDPTPKRKQLDPVDIAALKTPATLAEHLWPEYQRRAHTDLIAQAIADAEKEVSPKRAGPRVMIDQPPQSGKTETSVIWAAFWWLCKHPTKKLMIISYGIELAVERGDRIRKLVQEHGERYGLKLDPSTHAKHNWKLTAGGALRCFGIRTGISGHAADAIWIDDPTKSRVEADSPVYRAAVHNTYSGDINSRLAPGAPLFVVATRWDLDDLPGRRVREEGLIQNGGRWKQIHLPAICTDPANDPLGRALGEPLPHPHIEEGDTVSLLRHWEEKRSGSTVRDWGALYQGDPKPMEGALLTWELLRERRCFEHGNCGEPKRIAVAIDPSGGGEDAAGIIGGYLSTDDKLYLTHDRSGVMSSALWARKACELAAEIDADCFIVERDYGGDMAALNLHTTWAELRRENPDRYSVFIPKVIECKSGRRGKIVRAEPIAQQWIEGRIWTAQYLPDVESEWAVYQAGSANSPGRLDASVYMAIELLPMPASGEAQVVDPTQGNVDLIGRLSPGDMGLVR